MLSAIAARKAAKTALLSDTNDITETQSDQPAPSPPKRALSHSKRKISTSERPPQSKTKRQKISKPKGEKIVHEQGVIELDSEPLLSSGSYGSDRSLEEEDLDSRKRHWSPSAPVVDSSDDDERMPSPAKSEAPSPPRRPSTFQPTPEKNMFSLARDDVSTLGLIGDNGAAIALILSPDESICLLGSCSIVVVHGCVEACGGVLKASRQAYHVYAPRSSHLPIFRCISSKSHTVDNLPAKLQSLCHGPGSVVVLQELSTGIEGLESVCRAFDGVFRPSRSHLDEVYDLGLRGISLVMERSKTIQAFTLLPSWEAALSVLNSDSSTQTTNGVYLIKGPKKTGKSTFAVTLINRLLTKYYRVAFLECDVGQSEFTPTGMVTLHVIERPIFGPSFTHPALPSYAHFIGATSPRASPSHYLAAVESLMQSYRLDVQTPGLEPTDPSEDRIAEHIPLVVNTMGWIKGLGASLLESIENIIQPTHIFEFELPVQETWREPPVPLPRSSIATAIRHVLEPVVSSLPYTAADARSLSILSYFYSVFPDVAPDGLTQLTVHSWDASLPLCARPPYEVECSVAFDKVVLIGTGAEDVVHSELQRVLNGSIVALVSCEEASEAYQEPENAAQQQPVRYVQGSSPPSPSLSTCLGLALIRSISPDMTKMHIITPIPPSLLGKCRAIVKGELELPIWGMLDFRDDGGVLGFENKKVPYLQWEKTEGIGGERRRVRRNLMRRGQM